MKDALGNEVVIGSDYGYSRSQNGITHIRVGTIVKFNEKSVTMKVKLAKTAVYSDDPRDEVIDRHNISVKSNTLFPVNL